MYDSLGAVGILSAVATANQGWDVDVNDDVPTGCPSDYMIAVTNTTRSDKRNTGAAWGKISIDIGAPGTGIYSTVTSNSYQSMTGTSMASPHVAGTIAAMYANACTKLIDDYKSYPDSVSLIIKQMILDGACQVPDLYNRTVSGGRLNLLHALKNLDEYNCGNCTYLLADSAKQPSCSNSCDGWAKVMPVGTGVYTYTWSQGATTGMVQGLCPGFYSVTVTDTLTHCQQVRNFSMFRPDSIVIASIQTISATDSTPGNIIVSATAGNYNLVYSYDSVNYQPTSTLVVSGNGNYRVYVSNGNGCVVSRSVFLSSISEQSIVLSGVELYPNPANGVLNVSLNLAAEADVKFTISNIIGEHLITESKPIASGIHTATADISALPGGIYFITLQAGHYAVTKKFVVAR
jgi:hypothetical protein